MAQCRLELHVRNDHDARIMGETGILFAEICGNTVNILYLLNTQLVQDIIKNMYTHRNEKKDTKHSGKKAYTHKNTIKSKA